MKKFDKYKNPNDPKKEPLIKVASDILGLDFIEIKPKLNLNKIKTRKKKLVCISMHSTAQCKYWNNPTGWQEVINYLNKAGYEVLLLSSEENGYMGNIHPKGIKQLNRGSLEVIMKNLQESDLFIGTSSGLSWLAWACKVPTIIISGFTNEYIEPMIDVHRVINKDVCHGCWSDYKFDAGNWQWCPEHEHDDRIFECTKCITGEDVIKVITENNLIKI